MRDSSAWNEQFSEAHIIKWPLKRNLLMKEPLVSLPFQRNKEVDVGQAA